MIHVILEQSALLEVLPKLNGISSERSLMSVALKVSSEGLYIMTTDRIIAVYTHIPCEILHEGECHVPAKFFLDVLRELPPKEKITLRSEDEAPFLHVYGASQTGQKFLIKIPSLQGYSWQEPPVLEEGDRCSLSSAKLSYMIEQVSFAITPDAERNYGSVGFMHRPDGGQGKKLRLVGCDGYRLSYCEGEFSLPEGFLSSGISLTKKALIEIERVCHGGFEEVSFVLSRDKTLLKCFVTGYSVYVLLSHVSYPQYFDVVTDEDMSRVILGRSPLQSVTRRILLTTDKTKTVHMKFSDEGVVLTSETLGSAESKEELHLSGKRIESQLCLNGKFLTEIFSTMASESLALDYKGPEDPLIISPVNEPDGCRSVHILVPLSEDRA